jgi:transposase-like protein
VANQGPVPGRSPYEVVLSKEERGELEHRAACYSRPHREVQRAKLVLLAGEGKTNVEIGERLGMSREAVSRWRRRFCEERLAGLEDVKRRGRPRRFPPGRGRSGEGGRVPAAARAGRPALAFLPR